MASLASPSLASSTILARITSRYGRVYWPARRTSSRLCASVGAEGTFDFIIANALLIQYRAGVALRLTEPENHKVVPYISVGTSF